GNSPLLWEPTESERKRHGLSIRSRHIGLIDRSLQQRRTGGCYDHVYIADSHNSGHVLISPRCNPLNRLIPAYCVDKRAQNSPAASRRHLTHRVMSARDAETTPASVVGIVRSHKVS